MVFIISILTNIFLVDRYYIFEKRKILNEVASELKSSNFNNIDNKLESIEEKNNITIVYSNFNESIESINENIIQSLDKKKIKLNKFWITEDTLESLNEKSINKIYDQGITKYKVLAKFIKIDQYIFAICMPLPHMSETIKIINKFNIILMMFSIIFIVLLVGILSRKIVSPLENLKKLSRDIASLNFRTEEIKTNDEIEELSISINKMSESLDEAHKKIKFQNKSLKELNSDIAHELKTPLALIKVYAEGIEDGLDDGTYISEIQEQIHNMDELIEKLLYLSRIDNIKLNKSTFDLKEKTINILKKYKLLIEDADINLILNINENEKYLIHEDEESIDTVLNNLITNAIKYSNNKKIEISILRDKNNIKFKIKNGIEKSSEDLLENIWNPFYVIEKSRNKELSGTGLGLSIVRKLLEKNNLKFGMENYNNEILFYVNFNM